MKNLLHEPFLSFSNSIILFLLSSTGSVFMWSLSYLYNDAENLQFGHLLPTDKDRYNAVRSLVIAAIFYGLMTIVMTYELILHYRISRLESWDPSIAMTNVHTPKPSSTEKRHTPTLLPSEKLHSGASSHANEASVSGGRFRAGTASVIIKQQ